ncbi:MAG: prolipoprotein diacylglyceryl transferase, partial [Oscillospiraceae bacterium]|nr:prolipoprotein diacylglyceryl transferase [Oscillospiraceae bacterium]
KLRSYDGEVFLLYIAWYGLGRVFIEGMRTDSLMAGDLKISQIVAGASFVAALVLFIIFKVITEQKKIPLYVNTEECAKQLAADRAKDEERARLRAERKAVKEGVAQSILADDDEPDPDDGEFKDDSEYQDEIIDYTDDNNDNSDENDSGDTAENEDTDENNESEEE